MFVVGFTHHTVKYGPSMSWKQLLVVIGIKVNRITMEEMRTVGTCFLLQESGMMHHATVLFITSVKPTVRKH